MSEHVPSPDDAPPATAEETLADIEENGGRVFRYAAPPRVFILTTSQDLAGALLSLGGRAFLPAHLIPEDLAPKGAYKRAHGGVDEWDIEIASIPVGGDSTMWQAAGAFRHGRRT